MNKLFYYIFCATLFCIGTTACGDDNDDDILWDFVPYNATFIIEDAKGTNLLNANVKGNYLNEPFYIEFDGEVYPADWRYSQPAGTNGDNTPASRELPAIFRGFMCKPLSYREGDSHWVYDRNNYVLSFGEFDTTDNRDINFLLYVPGKEDPYKVKISTRFRWVSKNEPELSVTTWLNGKQVQDNYHLYMQWPPIRIVLPRLETPE